MITLNIEEVIGKTIHGYKIFIYVINNGATNYEAELTSTEVIQVRANNEEEVKEFIGENLFKVTAVA